MNANREELLFQQALARAADERVVFLNRECRGDAALRARLEALLGAHEHPDPLLGDAAGVVTVQATMKSEFAEERLDEAVGQTLGRYKLLEKVGEGGCGVVYVAEQTEPVRRRVALKVIKLGMDTRSVVARFEAERQALAIMDHPNIAKVLDAGSTEKGRPYFVMELVRGIRITEYCDREKLGTKERLDLFIKVCQAIQHAHQKGIIHRDIKPSNILVTLHDGVPVPKVIDFGIAKATEGRLTDATVYTQLHQFIGTPAYMSPEQAEMSGLDIDTRSDIYSLGVLLYELLAGTTPFDPRELMASGLDGMRKTIREKEPVRPSTRLATLGADQLTTTAKRRSADTSKLLHQLKGDLDWIVMKCLEKDRTRRYETANGLAADLKRHLNNEPVVARPPSKLYEFQKTVRRHKVGFAATAAVIVVLACGVVVSTWQSVRATRAQRQALAAEGQATAQRERAEINEQKALVAQASESKLRQQAEAAELAARQRAYASDMNVARQALAENNLGRALDLLNRQRPRRGQRDLRGWEWRYLWKKTRSGALFTLCQEPGEIYSLAASADGQWLAVGPYHEDGLAVWDLRTRQEVIRLAKSEGSVRVAFSPVEPLLAFSSVAYSDSGQDRSTLRLWNATTRQMVTELALDKPCIGLAFSRDGRTLMTSTVQGHITLWQMPAGTKLASHPSEQFGFSVQGGIAATPDLSLAVQTLSQGRIRAIDLRGGKELWTAPAAKEYITALVFSPDGKTLASAAGYTESDIRLWDAATGKEIGRLEGHGSWVGALVFWPDGKKLASSSADQTIRTWDVASRKCLDVLRGHRLEVWRLALLPDAKTLVSGGKDGTVCFWDSSHTHARPPRITVPTEGVLVAAFGPEGQSILTVNAQGQVSQWAGADFQFETPLLKLRQRVLDSSFSEDGRLLAACWTNGDLEVWDLSQRVLRHQLTNVFDKSPGPDFYDLGPKVMLSAGRLITWSKSENLLREWDPQMRVEKQSWGTPRVYSSMAFSPDGRQCVITGYKGDFFLHDLIDKSQRQLELATLEVGVGSYSPDGKLFAVASNLGFGRVWDAGKWQPLATLGGFLTGGQTLAFSADGKRLAIGAGDHEAVKLWDTESWQDVFTLEGEGTGKVGIRGARFSPDGNTMIWLNRSGVLHVWQAPSWEEIAVAEAKEKAESQRP